MPEASIRSQFNELKQDIDKLKTKRERLVGTLNEKMETRENQLKALRDYGMKKPEDPAYRKKFIAAKKKELLTQIKAKKKVVKDAIAKLEKLSA
jgi:uncharacterized membrane protein